jgi:hypothetical protein
MALNVDHSHQISILRTSGAIPLLPLILLHCTNRDYFNLIDFYFNDVKRAKFVKECQTNYNYNIQSGRKGFLKLGDQRV